MGRPRLTTTHCKRGHEYTAENIYIHPGKQYRRSCRACQRLSDMKNWHIRYKNDPEFRAKQIALAKKNYKKKTPKELRCYVNEQRELKKVKALTHYGKRGKLQCCWRRCTVSDIDMLSLDHIKDDGAEHRRKVKGNRISFAGKEIYHWAIENNFPEGFQTLCMNHQTKKQRMKTRAERLDY